MSELEYTVARKIIRMGNMIVARRNQQIRELGLTAEQADALLFFRKSEGKSAVDLKRHLGISHQAARGIIERLAEKNLLILTVSEEDARYKKVFLTEDGKNLCRKMIKNGTHTGSRLLYGLSGEEKQAFCSTIDLVLKNMGAE